MEIKGKVAVVTGAASGIGQRTAALLAGSGMKVVLADINADMLDAAVAAIRADGGEAIGVTVNVSDFASVKGLADKAYDTYGAVNLVHLNAGIASGASFFDDSIDDWRRTVDINLLGVVWGIKAFAQRMVDGGEDGMILATSSGAGAEGTSYMTSAYAATKIAVVSLMESLHGQLRDKQSRVKAGVVFPPLTQTRLGGDPATMKYVETHLQSNGVPAVLVQPEQVAAMVLDGVRSERFFINATPAVSESCYGGAMTSEFFDWNARMIRGRAEAQIADGKPDAYLW